MAWWREELMIDDFQTIIDLRLEEKEFAHRSIQQSTINNPQSSIINPCALCPWKDESCGS